MSYEFSNHGILLEPRLGFCNFVCCKLKGARSSQWGKLIVNGANQSADSVISVFTEGWVLRFHNDAVSDGGVMSSSLHMNQ